MKAMLKRVFRWDQKTDAEKAASLYGWIKQSMEMARFMRFLRNGRAVFHTVHGSNGEIRSLDFWDGTRLQTRDSTAAAHIFAEIFLARCYDYPEVRTADQIVDVGANIGLFSYFARRQNPSAKILAIEADPHTMRVLSTNVEGKQIQAIHSAASDRSGIVNFYSSRVSGWSSLYEVRGAANGEQVQVPAVRLSSLLRDRGIERIGLLKIDVEGAEYPILLGDRELMEIPIDALLVEVDRNPRDTRYSFGELYDLLQHNFRHVLIVDGGADYPLIYATNRDKVEHPKRLT
jgi:FkbM family methyltransferase